MHDDMTRCARGAQCSERSSTGEPALGPRAFCTSDRRHIHEALSRFPALYAELRTTLLSAAQRGPRLREETHTKAPYPPAPVRVDLDALTWDVETCLRSWALRVQVVARLSRVGHPLAGRRWGAPGTLVPRFCAILVGHLDTLLGLPEEDMVRGIAYAFSARYETADAVVVDHQFAEYREVVLRMSGADAGLEILWLAYQIKRALGHTPQHERLPVPCGACDLMGWLVRWDGAAGFEDGAYCLACGHEYTDNEFALLRAEMYRRAQLAM